MYQSWDDYCTREFGTTRLRLPREERAEVVASLRESGLSIRAIASATNEPVMTVQNELARVRDRTPEPDAESDALAEELIAEQELPPRPENYMNVPGAPTDSTPGQTDRVADSIAKAHEQTTPEPKSVIGIDGKKYGPTQHDISTPPRRKPIADEFVPLVHQLRKTVERIEKLSSDERFRRSDQVSLLERRCVWSSSAPGELADTLKRHPDERCDVTHRHTILCQFLRQRLRILNGGGLKSFGLSPGGENAFRTGLHIPRVGCVIHDHAHSDGRRWNVKGDGDVVSRFGCDVGDPGRLGHPAELRNLHSPPAPFAAGDVRLVDHVSFSSPQLQLAMAWRMTRTTPGRIVRCPLGTVTVCLPLAHCQKV